MSLIRVHVAFAVLAVRGLAVAVPYALWLARHRHTYAVGGERRWVLARFGFVMITVAAIGIVVTDI